jgi:hypothetical protein
MPMQMRDGENCGKVGLYEEEHAERKPVEDRPSKLAKDDRETQRAVFDPCKGCAKFSNEFRPKTLPLALVPGCRFEGIEFCLRPNVQPGHLPTGAEALLDSRKDFLPRSGFVRGSAIRRKTLLQEGLLPLLERHLVDIGRDVVPERLHVVNLVFDRKRVEPRGRQRQRV